MAHLRSSINDPELLKIILLCVAGAVVYGISHDQVTARIYPPYFNEFHPDLGVPAVFHSADPTVLGVAWGIVATWSVGLFLGVPLALSARLGRRPKLSWVELVRPIAAALLLMAAAAAALGCWTWFHPRANAYTPLPTREQRLFDAVLAVHQGSYGGGVLAGTGLCLWVARCRKTLATRAVISSGGHRF